MGKELIAFLLVIAAVFGCCFGLDKLFTKLFRGQVQHQSGLSVRLNKRYGSIGIIMTVLGIASLFTGLGDSMLLLVGGIILILAGLCLIVYYMSFGIFYDDDSFILTQFGKHSGTYHYRDIQSQQLYNATGNVVVELFMKDGRSVSLTDAMTGEPEFLNFAFKKWLKQTGRKQEDCSFYDPDNSCWFPPAED